MSARIEADRHACQGIGMCETQADDYFEVGADDVVSVLNAEVPDAHRSYIRAAVDACPVSALRLVD